MSAVAKRYARAAIAAALDMEGAIGVEKLAHSVSTFRAMYDKTSELRDLLANPALKADRDAVLGTVLDKIGASKTAVKLIQLLAGRDRVEALRDVADEIEAEADNRAGRLRARVVSSIPLDDAKIQRLKGALHKRFQRDIVVDVKVDPELLGGLVCKVGDLTLDSSLKRQIELLREQLGTTVS
ncbi:MAG: ATP synthase F1 subunit delta [Myxococcota bacterium]